MAQRFSDFEKENFFTMVDSLKKCRRANLSDINDDENIIEKLYVDPLHNDFIFKMCLQPNTTILIGRKGTGKSTIIARLQHEIRKSNDRLSLYIDVNSIFDQTKAFQFSYEQYKNVLAGEELEKYLMLKTFLKNIIDQIRDETKTNTLKFFLAKISSIFGPDQKQFTRELDSIFNEIDEREFEDILIIKEKLVNSNSTINDTNKDSLSTRLNFDTNEKGFNFGGNLEAIQSSELNRENKIESKFSEILLQYFNPQNILKRVKNLLQKIGIKYVFICLDDFSEIDEQAMKAFVDTIIAPLNNWSDEFFKFKIAAYPGRVYLGNIDPTKIEQIKLDFFDLYMSNKVTDIEQGAINSIERLLTQRFNYFCNESPEYFFDLSSNDIDTYYKYIFDITANVPRNIGWILWYANQNSISKDRPITIRDLELGAEKFYIDAIEVFFSQNKYMKESFDEKFEKYHLNELLNNIIKEAKINKREISKSDLKGFESEKERPLSSHFHILKIQEDILKTLELNFFVTKVNEQKDFSANLVSVYCLNYGLCQKEDINFGKSKGKYVIQRWFNYSKIINQYINNAKNIVCDTCGKVYSMDYLNNLKLFDMLCPTCKKGHCKIEHVKVELPIVDENIVLPEFDLRLLNALKIFQPQFAKLLAQELDCYYQKVVKRITILSEQGLVEIKKETLEHKYGKRSYYYITETAQNTYFKEPEEHLSLL